MRIRKRIKKGSNALTTQWMGSDYKIQFEITSFENGKTKIICHTIEDFDEPFCILTTEQRTRTCFEKDAIYAFFSKQTYGVAQTLINQGFAVPTGERNQDGDLMYRLDMKKIKIFSY